MNEKDMKLSAQYNAGSKTYMDYLDNYGVQVVSKENFIKAVTE